ncbi:MAG: hypothetical protein WC389_18260 [Lutibacter sp.]|jgi:hypothetical protein
MEEFGSSKFMTDLKAGKLPEVEVNLSVVALRNIGLTLVISASLIILLNAVVKKVI